jgi:membrane protease YdiL (CAAX protease family)
LYHAAPGASLSASDALVVVLAAMGTLLAVGGGAVSFGAAPYGAMAIAQVGMLAVALVSLRLLHRPPRALGLAAAPGIFVLASVLIGVSAWYLNLALVDALIEVEPEDVETLQRAVARPSLSLVLLAVALAPAICEEVVFRGALLRGLASRIPPLAALVISSAMFALYHVRPVQMLPTFTLGLSLGLLSLRAGSILPAVIAHFLNNTMAILVSRQESHALSHALDAHPYIALGAFAVIFFAGLAVAVFAPLAPPPPPPSPLGRPLDREDTP